MGQALSHEAREHLAYYIAVLVMRGPRKRRKGYDLAPSVLNETIAELRSDLSQVQSADHDGRLTELLTELARVEAHYRQQLPANLRDEIESP